MQPTVTPTNATVGAVLTDVDLANLDDATGRVVENAFHDFGALIFPNQHLTEEAQIAFAKRFGDLELLTPDDTMKAVSISNQKENGSVYDPEDFRYKTLRGNEGWHTDSSYMPLAAKVSILSAQVVPEEGGETEVADMRAAYDELSDSMKDRVSGLEAYHSLYQSQAKIGYNIETGAGYGYHTKGAPLRPLVKTHPITGRKSLFIGRHAYEIPGMEQEEGQKLLDELVTFACQPPRIYTHRWQPGDVLMWDNRCVLHRARPYDFSEIRVLRHTRVAGDPKSELVTTGRDERASDFRPSTSNRPDLPQLNKTSF
ncbi:MAG TPA: TauD/TfdA family dioxygenase [Alphaproteobacteria bacterium]|jgi:alpha-ketoglutarate-dependent taurine dioxygenase|nr:TauD/TfdA family dioxygenase [Alphaproteobacteria bacterium]HIN93362.1 TauD/TfdA family dioxygenase [Alphaproteobacteria bacterium]HIO03090.1 TauD/TfdA family dioxygenase [Alphaproteobacteria bacterium]